MPEKLSYKLDIAVVLLTVILLTGLLFTYNFFVGLGSVILVIVLGLFLFERYRERSRQLQKYYQEVVGNINAVSKYAIENLPQGILIVGEDGRLAWANEVFRGYAGRGIHVGAAMEEILPGLSVKDTWAQEGELVFEHKEKFYHVFYRPAVNIKGTGSLMTYYISDVTEGEVLKRQYALARTVIAYIQVDNYDEVFQGLTEAERTSLLFTVNKELDDWAKNNGIFIRRVAEDLYVAMMERRSLDKAMGEKFEILDRVRLIKSSNKIPVTLSIGVAVAEEQQASDLGTQAQNELDLSLGRGGDQVAVLLEGKTQFFGGKTNAVEKHTRVKSRVVAHALRELLESSDEVFIMGHHNEDFDVLGAAMGVARMAAMLDRPVHIVLSEMHAGIDKFMAMIRDQEEYRGLFVYQKDILELAGERPLAVVVDAHMPHMVAAPSLLTKINNTVIIDHHRRGERIIEKPMLRYLEPSASSASEMVTELMMYFEDNMKLSKYDATALYAGIIIDTKNFAVQAGVRTFDAAAYLRRAGADPQIVKELFQQDYRVNVAIAKIKADSKLHEDGFITSVFNEVCADSSIIAAQAADSLLAIEGIKMTLVVYRPAEDVVGVSARSNGENNVQVIMEEFGGGGHQNVAGAQIKGADIDDIEAKLIHACQEYMKENKQK